MITVSPIFDAAWLPGHVRRAARVSHGLWRREKIWFETPQAFGDDISPMGNHWLMALLPLAFQRGEGLRINAPVDAVLLENAEKIQRIWAGWFPPLKPIRIQAEIHHAPVQPGGKNTGLFFTGGVDSFFSLLHGGEMPGGKKIDDLVYVWGYDIPLTNRAAFEGKVKTLSRLAAQLGKNAVPVATNLRQTRLRKLDWALRLHGPALGAAGLFLGGRFRHILVSSSQSPDDVEPWGSHFLTTWLMSSATTRFNDYGAEFHRLEKFAFIASSDLAVASLHVCFEDGSDRNCGRCGKCQRALLAFELLGVRARAVSFPQADFSVERLKTSQLDKPIAYVRLQELRALALEKSRPDVVTAIDACLAANAALRPGETK